MRVAYSFLGIVLFAHQPLLGKNALTFNPGNNRFGDQLMAYIRAKRVAHIHNLDFFVPPFAYSDQLALSKHEKPYTPAIRKKYRHYNKIQTSSFIRKTHRPILYESDFTIKIPTIDSFDTFYYVCKRDPLFSAELKKCIAPLIPIADIQFPPDAHIIAVHVRQGGGFDAPLCNTSNTLSPPTLSLCADKIWPTKFPPCDFYSNALNYLINRYPQQHLHVHIFTDAENPEEITKRVSKALPSSSLTFSYRKENNRHDSNVLEDLFAMARCDYLIRPQSSYSRVAQLIGDHRLIISPIKAVWKNNTLMVTEISIVSRN